MKTYLIDLDGTMYRGNQCIDGAIPFINYLLSNNIPFLFVTNNATRTRKQNVEHMERLGFQGIKEEHFYTSSIAAAKYMKKHSQKRKTWFIGKKGLEEALIQEGFQITEDHPDFVFVGLDVEGSYDLYSKALRFLLNGAKLIGTNTDRRLASNDGYIIGNGSVIKMLEYASGQESEKIGKPYAPMLEGVLDYLQLSKEDVIIIGDNLETDISLGTQHGVETIFVTSGVHQKSDCEKLQIFPTHKIENLKELIK